MNLKACELCRNRVIALKYDTHVAICELKYKPKLYHSNNNTNILPDDIEELKTILKKVLKKVDCLEEEVEILKKNQSFQKRKQISSVLNERDCNIEIFDWLNSVIVSNEDIDKILTTNIIIGLKTFFENLTKNKYEIPIAAFIQKENRIYLYDNSKWHIASTTDIIKLLDSLRVKFLRAFSLRDEDEYKKYGKPIYALKGIVYGSDYKDDRLANEIKKILFQCCKVNLEKNTIDDIEE